MTVRIFTAVLAMLAMSEPLRRIGLRLSARKRGLPSDSAQRVPADDMAAPDTVDPSRRAVATSERQPQLLVESLTDYALCMLDSDGRILSWNSGAERLNGYSAEEAVGRHFSSLFTEEDQAADEPARALADALLAGRHISKGWRVAKDGRRFRADAVINPIYDAGGLVGYATITRDVTLQTKLDDEILAAKAAAETALAAKSDFLANMSREIRAPLTGILGFSGLLKGLKGLPNIAQTYIDRITTSGEALLSVVNDILDFSKLAADQVGLNLHDFDPVMFVNDTVKLISAEAARKGLYLRVETDAALPRAVSADDLRARQVLLNLLTNAIKFTDEGGITVRAAWSPDNGGSLFVSVADTGRGIAPDRTGGLFERFSHAESSATHKYGGTGLGLAISKQLIELMGGEIGVDSREGEGSTFWFRISASASSALEQTAPQWHCALDLSAVRILIVDDVPMVRELVADMLSDFGAELSQATNGIEAVAAANSAEFDLILMDYQMPQMGGVEATRRIRMSSALNRNTPILAFSTNVLPAHIAECLEAGMNDHIAKPILPNDLFTKVKRWTSNSTTGEKIPMDPPLRPLG